MMQPAAQSAPQPTTAPQGTPTGIALPGGTSIPLGSVPGSPREVQGLRERREILRDQLSRAVNRREELLQELNQGTAPESRAGVQQRLNLLDARILEIERDQALTERQLSNAPPEVLAMASADDQQRTDMNHMVDEDEAIGFTFVAFGTGVVLTYLAGRFRRSRMRKRDAKRPVAALGEDPRLERLTEAVDAIAEEVERIGEGQRFVTQLLSTRREQATITAAAEER